MPHQTFSPEPSVRLIEVLRFMQHQPEQPGEPARPEPHDSEGDVCHVRTNRSPQRNAVQFRLFDLMQNLLVLWQLNSRFVVGGHPLHRLST